MSNNSEILGAHSKLKCQLTKPNSQTKQNQKENSQDTFSNSKCCVTRFFFSFVILSTEGATIVLIDKLE